MHFVIAVGLTWYSFFAVFVITKETSIASKVCTDITYETRSERKLKCARTNEFLCMQNAIRVKIFWRISIIMPKQFEQSDKIWCGNICWAGACF